MHISQPVPHHRLQRLHRWAMLWLTGFAAFLEVAADLAPISKAAHKIAHGWLNYIEQLIICIIIVRVAPHVRQGSHRKAMFDHRRSPPSFFRAVLGSRLRRMLRSRDLHQRIAALRHSIDDLVARVLKRIPRGLTRRRPIKAPNWTASAAARIFPHALNHAGEGVSGSVADTS